VQGLALMPAHAPPIRPGPDEVVEDVSPWRVGMLLATRVHRLCIALDRRIGRPPTPQWTPSGVDRIRDQSPLEALVSGATLNDLLNVGLRDALRRSIGAGVRATARSALRTPAGTSLGLPWYGQHDAHWIAYYDAYRRCELSRFSETEHRELNVWAATARSCGWWWPMDGWCVVTERTAVVHTEPWPGTHHAEVRAHHPRGMAVAYPDGTGGYAWHGTPVPSWVITDPAVERVLAERNVEVRRCAIERIGWDTYISEAGLRLVSAAPDPGNPGCELQLYDLPHRLWGAPARVLLAINGSVERDGHRRRYGLSVPGDIDDPVAAAGWSYGMSGAQYAGLLRRT
jgi:hypothetical protein